MDFTRIGEDRLKAVIDGAELESFSLHGGEISYADTTARKAIWSILDEAKRKTGFDAASGRAYIQIYPSHGGGCEMYVTMLKGENASDGGSQTEVVEEKTEKAVSLYRFDTLSYLLSACRDLKNAGFCGKSSALVGENEFYLIFSDVPDVSLTDAISGEFGQKLPENALPLLSENTGTICGENAVSVLSGLA